MLVTKIQVKTEVVYFISKALAHDYIIIIFFNQNGSTT